MTTLTDHRTVGEIAAEYPATVRVFQKHQIDFCCGGNLPLRDACAERGLAPAEVLEELSQAASGPAADTTDWNKATLSALIGHIVGTHHEYLKSELPRLSEMLDRVIVKHNAKYGGMPARLGEIFTALRAELESHLMKEERVLFPLVEQMESAAASGIAAPPSHCGSVNNPIRVMVHEHDAAGNALAEMRAVTINYALPEDACNTTRALYHGLQALEEDLHQHIHLENNILFPKAAALEAGL